MKICDSHIHLAECSEASFPIEHFCASCSHSPDEFYSQKKIAAGASGKVLCAFGIHPQNPLSENYSFLEDAAEKKIIDFIGETGFDFFTPELRSNFDAQKKAFEFSLNLASVYGLPILIHNRKALDEMFKYTKTLRNIPSVVFHSFPFGPREAESLLSHGINCYFSFGKPLLNNSKKAIECVRNLPLDRILLETDAPYQTLRGESETFPSDIQKVYSAASQLRKIDFDSFSDRIYENFIRCFNPMQQAEV